MREIYEIMQIVLFQSEPRSIAVSMFLGKEGEFLQLSGVVRKEVLSLREERASKVPD